MKRLKTFILGVVLCVSSLGLTGCGSLFINSHKQKESLIDVHLRGDTAKASELIEEQLKSKTNGNDHLMWYLEAGANDFYGGNYLNSIEHFKVAEKMIEEYDERAIISLRDTSAEGAMAVTNLNALPYRGFCRDRMMLPSLKALAYLGKGDEEVFNVQIRRLREAQKEIQESHAKYFEEESKAIKTQSKKDQDESKKIQDAQRAIEKEDELNTHIKQIQTVAHEGYGNFMNPFSIFLSGLGSLREGRFDNAAISFERLYKALPKSEMAQKLYVTAATEADVPIIEPLKSVKPYPFPIDRDVIYVIFANGRGPSFEQVSVHFPIMTAWPVCTYYPSEYTAIEVTADQQQTRGTLLANMDAIISQEYQDNLPAMIARITISTLVKESASYVATTALMRENAYAGVGMYLVSMVYRYAVNTADTRSWELLPKSYDLAILPMPKNKIVNINLLGTQKVYKQIKFSSTCQSAIIYVNAPSSKAITYQILEMKSK